MTGQPITLAEARELALKNLKDIEAQVAANRVREARATTRITSLRIARMHNLGNYEHVRYEVTVDIGPDENAAAILNEVEKCLQGLRPTSQVSSYDYMSAKALTGKDPDSLTELEKKQYVDALRRVKLYEGHEEKRKAAMLRLNELASVSRKYEDFKDGWRDDEDDDRDGE